MLPFTILAPSLSSEKSIKKQLNKYIKISFLIMVVGTAIVSTYILVIYVWYVKLML